MKMARITSLNYKMYVIVVGCGKIGREVAVELSRMNFNVTVIDKYHSALSSLPETFGGFTIVGDATEQETLKKAKANKADIMVVTTPNDPTNYFISMLGENIFGIPQVLSLVNNHENTELFKKSEIGVISPIKLSVDNFKENVLGTLEFEV